ncbi:hypothetical protein PDESU_02433 [Pontiella desulfatans]|uniref:Uncharacterized protein n=1 Tax=Pontiella desulfatans TaxID=2750659 RepID=A0A6C2U3E0_PONDE|nr:hypothetical protein [Pontiella desulfatans]VGO13876.1 hypothetical protein PDESU_02433 [Pontiella desulfatans]
MTKSIAKRMIADLKQWFVINYPDEDKYQILLRTLKYGGSDDEAFIHPFPLYSETDNAKPSRDLIDEMQEQMDNTTCPLRTSVRLLHEDGLGFVVLGTEAVDMILRHNGLSNCLRKVYLTFDKNKYAKGDIAHFSQGDILTLEARSPLKGYMHLFHIDTNRILSPIYPGEGEISSLQVSQNFPQVLTDKINSRVKAESRGVIPTPLKFYNVDTGRARIVAVVLKEQVPMTCSHLKQRLPLPKLYSHELKYKVGLDHVNSSNDFLSLELDQIAIGTLDYYYEG